MSLAFAPATKKAAKGRVAIDGPSGSGKTFTALTIATVLGDRIAVIDTEHGSASKYADLFKFDTLEPDKFSPHVLIEALGAASGAGYDVVIADSLSHFWMGVDGMLEQVDRAGKRAGGHGMAGWKEMRPVERQMVEAMLAYPGHLIGTMRVKTDWVEGENSRGKRQMLKVGTKPEQREGMEYEFDLYFSMDLENVATVSKSRCPALNGAVVKQPGQEFAQTFLDWLSDGVAAGPSVAELRDKAVDKHATRDELLALLKTVQAARLLDAPTVDDTGDSTTLGDLIKAKGAAAAAREKQTASAGAE
jgi:hypothetical protein